MIYNSVYSLVIELHVHVKATKNLINMMQAEL